MALVDDRTMTMAERARQQQPIERTEPTETIETIDIAAATRIEPPPDRGSRPAPAPAPAPAPERARRAAPKRVFLLVAFRCPGLGPEAGPINGMAEDVVAVMGMDDTHQRFEWVGRDQLDSIANPALITPVEVRLALPSPWHADDPEIATGLVPLAEAQLGDGSLDDDIDHLLAELANSR